MAYDEALAERIRKSLATETAVSEKKMFGGLAFLINGHMAIAASGQDGILVRVDPEKSDEIVASTKAEPMIMRGRAMAGWLRVAAEDVKDDSELEKWARLGLDYCLSLPPKD